MEKEKRKVGNLDPFTNYESKKDRKREKIISIRDKDVNITKIKNIIKEITEFKKKWIYDYDLKRDLVKLNVNVLTLLKVLLKLKNQPNVNKKSIFREIGERSEKNCNNVIIQFKRRGL